MISFSYKEPEFYSCHVMFLIFYNTLQGKTKLFFFGFREANET